jgi:hypothetical protein
MAQVDLQLTNLWKSAVIGNKKHLPYEKVAKEEGHIVDGIVPARRKQSQFPRYRISFKSKAAHWQITQISYSNLPTGQPLSVSVGLSNTTAPNPHSFLKEEKGVIVITCGESGQERDTEVTRSQLLQSLLFSNATKREVKTQSKN